MNRLFFIICILSFHFVSATIRNVPSNYPTISAALNVSQNGDTILVDPGTYSEDIIWPDRSGIKLLSSAGSSLTIIEGTGTGSVVKIIPGPTSQIDSTTIIDGFQITNGSVDTVKASGGGIFIFESSPVLRNLDVHNNSVISNTDSSFGGGIFVGFNSHPLIESCAIHDNQSFGTISGYGGGISFKSNSNAEIINCEIYNNEVTSGNKAAGGGLAISDSSLVKITDCNIHHNTNRTTSLTGGGGVYIFGNSTATILNSRITENLCDAPYADGGGVFIYNNTGFTIENCTVERNLLKGPFDHSGGGVFSYNSNGEIIRTSISENRMEGIRSFRGAGLFGEASAVLLKNSQIRSNRIIPDSTTIAGLTGGGVYCSSSTLNFENCLVVENKIDTNAIHTFSGSGLLIISSYVTMDHCIVADNEFINDTTIGAGIYLSRDSIRFINSIIWNPLCNMEIDTTITFSIIENCDVKNGDTLNGNINSDPLFIGSGDYHLTQSSLCLNAGNFNSSLPFDIDGNPRPMPIGTNPDIGAYELDQIVGINFIEPNIKSSVLPNPVSSNAIISLVGDEEKIIQIKLFDDLGKLQFFESNLFSNQYFFNAEKLTKGIYFYELTTKTGKLSKGKFVVN